MCSVSWYRVASVGSQLGQPVFRETADMHSVDQLVPDTATSAWALGTRTGNYGLQRIQTGGGVVDPVTTIPSTSALTRVMEPRVDSSGNIYFLRGSSGYSSASQQGETTP